MYHSMHAFDHFFVSDQIISAQIATLQTANCRLLTAMARKRKVSSRSIGRQPISAEDIKAAPARRVTALPRTLVGPLHLELRIELQHQETFLKSAQSTLLAVMKSLQLDHDALVRAMTPQETPLRGSARRSVFTPTAPQAALPKLYLDPTTQAASLRTRHHDVEEEEEEDDEEGSAVAVQRGLLDSGVESRPHALLEPGALSTVASSSEGTFFFIITRPLAC